jgi:hypothetical protein
MPQVHWKDYIIDIYNQNTSYYYFDFYNVYDLSNGEFKFVGNLNKDFTLENFRDVLLEGHERYRVDPDFTIFYRIDPSDTRFYASELLVEENTFDIIKEALVFCGSFYKERLKDR